MYTHTSFGFCVTDHKQWFPEWAKHLLNKCTCAHLTFFFKKKNIAALSPCLTVHLFKRM